MNVIFFGTSEYCLPVLQCLKNNFRLAAIVTKKNSVIARFAQNHKIPCVTPADKTELILLKDKLSSLSLDLAVVSDYGLIIPPEIFNIPKLKTLNIHFSLLPGLRGPSPVQYTILTGEKSAGISVIVMDKDMDTGDIIWQEKLNLNGNETTGSLYRYLFDLAATKIRDVINKYAKKELIPQKQTPSKATYTKHFTRDDGYIPSQILAKALKETADNSPIERKIRAFTPWPGAWTMITLPPPKRLKLLKAHLEGKKLMLDLVQLEGKKPVSWKQFLEGYPRFTL